MQLVLDSTGITVKKRNECFYVSTEKQSRLISPHKITSIAVLADCMISAAVIRLAAKHEIAILFFNRTGKVESRLWSPKFGSIATIRRNQVFFGVSKEATAWVVELFQLKTRHQVQNIDYLINRRKSLAVELSKSKMQIIGWSDDFNNCRGKYLKTEKNKLLGIEGNIARRYWESIALVLPEPWTFTTRNRRPATDFFNALLNYRHGMMYSQVESAIFTSGLDPYLGIFHVDEYNKPSLTFDLIEPFRSWVDRFIIESCLQEKIEPSFFENKNNNGIWISKAGKKFLIPSFNTWIEKVRLFDHKKLSTKNHIHRFAGLFAQKLKDL